jgi:hypothetical protein
MRSATAEIAEIQRRLATQDNRSTSHPIFIVQERIRETGWDTDYIEVGRGGGVAWVDSESPERLITESSNPGLFARLEEFETDEPGREDMWIRTGYRDRWEFVQPFLTLEAAEAFRRREAHNLGETRVYVESGHRNPEWKWLRALLVELLPLAEERADDARDGDGVWA